MPQARCIDGAPSPAFRAAVLPRLVRSGPYPALAAIAETLAASPYVGGQLIVTGSPLADRFPLPARTDRVTLPCVTKLPDGRYVSRDLPIAFDEVRRLREGIIKAAARGFEPSLVIVDHAPAGMAGEILPTLRYLKARSPETRIVLGLRDVVDDPARVRPEWSALAVDELLEGIYDRILVYGQRDVYDPVSAYAMSASSGQKVRFVGYLGRVSRTASYEEADRRQSARPSVLVTVGGGGDGQHLIETICEAIRGHELPAGADYLVVGGPFLPAETRARFKRTLAKQPHARFVEFVPDLPERIRRADAVIAMGGYNTACEILSSRTPALIVPRVAPRLEQWVRAGALARRGLVRMVHPDKADARRLAQEIGHLLSLGPTERRGVALDGLAQTRAEVNDILARRAVAA